MDRQKLRDEWEEIVDRACYEFEMRIEKEAIEFQKKHGHTREAVDIIRNIVYETGYAFDSLPKAVLIALEDNQ